MLYYSIEGQVGFGRYQSGKSDVLPFVKNPKDWIFGQMIILSSWRIGGEI